MGEKFRRKSPEEFLQSIHKVHRGRLKIILGAVSGSGKTYHMLLEGNALKRKAIDVVVGTVSASDRPRTIEQIGALERIAPIEWMEGGSLNKIWILIPSLNGMLKLFLWTPWPIATVQMPQIRLD